MQKKRAKIRKREKDGAKMELRRNGTIIPIYSSIHGRLITRRRGGRISDFSFVKSRSKHLKLVYPHKPWNY
jgi:hypothetical protein